MRDEDAATAGFAPMTAADVEGFIRGRRDPVAVDVPNMGRVYIRHISAGEKDSLERSMISGTANGRAAVDMTNFRAKLLQLSLCTESGEQMFTVTGIPLLATMPVVFADVIIERIRSVNGMTNEVQEETKRD